MTSNSFSPTAELSQGEEQLADLIGEYGQILAHHGAASREADKFLESNQQYPELQELARTAARLKDVAREHEENVMARRRRARWLLVASASLLVFAMAGAILMTFLSAHQAKLSSQGKEAAEQKADAAEQKADAAEQKAVETSKRSLWIGSSVYAELVDKADEHIPRSAPWGNEQLARLRDIEFLAEVLPPEKNASDWSAPELYAWAKAAFVDWDRGMGPDKLAEAERRLDFTLSLHPNFGKVYALKAQVVNALGGHADEAVALYRQAIQKDDQLAYAHNNLAWLLKDRADEKSLEEAIAEADRAWNIGKAKYAKDKREPLASYYDTAAVARDRLAEVYEKQGNNAAAQKLRTEAKEMRTQAKSLSHTS
jgi:hypothetical protein